VSTTKNVSITPENDNTIFRKIARFFHVNAFRTTLRTMLRVPITDLYAPGKEDSHYPAVPHRYRGLLALSQKACTGCRKCERICPNNTIIMETRNIEGTEYRFPGYFAGRCMKCGLCEEVCDRQWAIRHTDQWEDAGFSREQLYYGPERMWKMWEKHIEPRIQAGIAHKSVPDKRRWERDNIHENIDFSDAPEPEVPEEFMETVEAKQKAGKKEYGFNAPVGRWSTESRR